MYIENSFQTVKSLKFGRDFKLVEIRGIPNTAPETEELVPLAGSNPMSLRMYRHLLEEDVCYGRIGVGVLTMIGQIDLRAIQGRFSDAKIIYYPRSHMDGLDLIPTIARPQRSVAELLADFRKRVS